MNDTEILSTKAQTFLRTAEQVLSMGDCDSCASRCYYAMFLMAQAALLTKDLSASSHKGVISLFGEHFAKTGILGNHMGKALNYAYRKRIVGDYGVSLSVTREEAEELLEAAKDFVQKVRNYLDQWAQKEGRQ
ncbi:MAG: HEPN domain-containing protein [Phycisphaerales bacterium]